MIPLFKVHMPADVDWPLIQTLHSGYVGEGPRVKEFEAALARLLGAGAAAMNSGTAALTLAYRLVGVGPGDAVVTTPMTCTATNLPILGAGARPVWADVDPRSGLIEPNAVRDLLRRETRRVKAIVCVDWGGMPCALGSLLEIGDEFGLPVIEDAAHALGARYMLRPVGSVADLTAFSFQAIKHITTVEGGALAVRDAGADPVRVEVLRRARRLRWFGIDRDAPAAGDSRIDVDIEEWGYKANMNDAAAAIGLAQLPHLSRILAAHRRNAAFYRGNLPEVFGGVPEPDGRESAWWLYTVRLPDRARRDAFKAFALARGVQVSQVHRRNDEYTVFREYALSAPDRLPGLDEFSDRMVCLPVHWGLTPDDLRKVVQVCEEFAAGVPA